VTVAVAGTGTAGCPAGSETEPVAATAWGSCAEWSAGL